MNLAVKRTLLSVVVLPWSLAAQDLENLEFKVRGLTSEVEILVDRWGISHIYANNERDLFFAQGFNAARDRLFQFEVWRMQATGTVSEVTGEQDIKRDHGTRLFKFRQDIGEEMRHYHPRGDTIITAYVDGVNEYIRQTTVNRSLLPIEFDILGIRPKPWTPEVVISRHQGLLGNIGRELAYGRQVAKFGPELVKELNWFHPWGEPEIALDPKINGSLLSHDILGLYNAFRRGVQFKPEHVNPGFRTTEKTSGIPDAAPFRFATENDERQTIGSNNWIISGKRSASGYPMMANDPHRVQAVPSLRYIVHLNAPGWDVIGGGEPEIPGVSIGHNGYGAWGLTVFSTDGEDLYVYDTNPENALEYRYMDGWETMSVISEKIKVRGGKDVSVDLKYSRHGPVVYEDEENNKAYAVRAAWMEIGGSPYLASLRMNQSRSWEEFRDACNYSNIPGENMIWADKDGNIGWQSVGIAPIRRNWSGLVPVPGDGSYEWDGYLEIIEKPHVVNPTEGYFATANSNLTPQDYPYRQEAIGWEWSDPFRTNRINEVLNSDVHVTMTEMAELQTDFFSPPARQLVPLLSRVTSANWLAEKARKLLLDWDFRLNPESIEAGVYVAFQREVRGAVRDVVVPEEAKEMFPYLSLKKTLDWVHSPDGRFGTDPLRARDELLLTALEAAVADLSEQYGRNPDDWTYGQTEYKHITLSHALSPAVNSETKQNLNVGPAIRGGDSYTVNNTGPWNNQRSGASFRIIVDTENWDRTLAMNNPGQSGDPASPFYKNLFQEWSDDGFFPLFYSREKVESVTAQKILLKPVTR